MRTRDAPPLKEIPWAYSYKLYQAHLPKLYPYMHSFFPTGAPAIWLLYLTKFKRLGLTMYMEALAPPPLFMRSNQPSRTKQTINFAASVKWQPIKSAALRELKKKGSISSFMNLES